MKKNATEKNLDDLRKEIDALDDEIIALFEKRMQACLAVGNYKKTHDVPVLNANREQEVIERLVKKAPSLQKNFIRDLYETIFRISRDAQKDLIEQKKFCLIGRNLVYSFSKDIHGAFASYQYDLVNLEPNALKDFFAKKEFAGCNVTIPYKRDVYALCKDVSDCAKKIGCVNTVVLQKDGTLYGDNTDYYGFAYMAERAGITFAGKKVLVFGSGATSGTVCAVVRDFGGDVTVISRSGQNRYTDIARFTDAQILINTTPVGTYPDTENQIADIAQFTQCEGVLDVVYNPLESRFVQQAKSLGIKCSCGLAMLVAQAKRAAELFTGTKIDDSVTEQVINKIKRSKQNIILIGMPGSGKSTIAKALASKLQKPLVDIDGEIEKIENMTIPQIFAKKGEAYFRAKECAVIADVAKKSSTIIATGGGSVLNARNQRNFRQNGFVVFLTRPLDCLDTSGRPLSSGDGAVQKLYAERLPYYKALADVSVANDASVEDATQKIIDAWQNQ